MKTVEEMICENYTSISDYAKYLCCGNDVYNDLIQDTCLKILENKDKILGYGPDFLFLPYVRVTMKHIYLNRLRYEKLRRYEDLGEETIGGETKEEDGLEFEILDIIQGLELSEEDKHILGFMIHGYTYEEISSGLGIRLGTVKSRIHRLRGKIKKALGYYSSDL